MKNFILILIFAVIGGILGFVIVCFLIGILEFLEGLSWHIFSVTGNLPAGLVSVGYGMAVCAMVAATLASKELVYSIPVNLNSLRFAFSFVLILIINISLLFVRWGYWILAWIGIISFVIPIIIVGKVGLHKTERLGISILTSSWLFFMFGGVTALFDTIISKRSSSFLIFFVALVLSLPLGILSYFIINFIEENLR